MRGRPPKPTALHLLSGGKGKRVASSRKREPKPRAGAPARPRWLQGSAREEWNRLVKVLTDMRVLTVADRGAIEMAAAAYGEYRECTKVVAAEGRTYTTTTEGGDLMHRPRPEVAMAASAWTRYRGLLSELGLTPAARAKVKTVEEPPADPVSEWEKAHG